MLLHLPTVGTGTNLLELLHTESIFWFSFKIGKISIRKKRAEKRKILKVFFQCQGLAWIRIRIDVKCRGSGSQCGSKALD